MHRAKKAMAMKGLLRSLLLLAAMLPLGAALVQPAAGQQVSQIAAVVDDDIVTTGDIEARMALNLMSSGLPATQANRRLLMPITLRALIDESLQLREASRRGILVDDAELAGAIEGIAQRNGMSTEAFRSMLGRAGVPISTLERQVRASIAWSRLIQFRYIDALAVTDVDIETYLRDLEANRGSTEHLIGEIFMAVDTPEREPEVRALAESLVREMRGGVRFSMLAQQFSQSASAAQGGDAGWMMSNQLAPELAPLVETAAVGSLVGPVRTLTGYHILMIRDRRQVLVADPERAQISLRQAIVGYGAANPTQAQFDQAMNRARALRNNTTGCADFMQRAGGSGTDIGFVTLRDLPRDLRNVIEPLSVGGITQPLPSQEGIFLFMVCDRREPGSALPTPDEVEDLLMEERFEVLQQRLLRDLRGAANIDIRIEL